MTLQGIVQNYHHLIVTRTLLGLFESGFFPAATYLLTCWHVSSNHDLVSFLS